MGRCGEVAAQLFRENMGSDTVLKIKPISQKMGIKRVA
jgi:hypothetical protein